MEVGVVQVELLSSGPSVWTVIAGIVGIAGVVLSVLALYRQRARVGAKLNTAYKLDGPRHMFVCDFTFINHSPLAISIIDLVVTSKGQGDSFPVDSRVKLKTMSTRSSSGVTSKAIYTGALPIEVGPYSAVRVSIAFKETGFLPFGSDYVARESDCWNLTIGTPRKSFKSELVPPTSDALWAGASRPQFTDFEG
ncbi:hypothetical protein LJB76_02595 [Clostridia bacterium OttesenSCG-928-O13]|nr:hypothetical protein [Clostridia bacterium OttesenSCG-928-O13]